MAKKTKLKLNDLIEVFWLDIVANASWLSLEKAQNYNPSKCYSVGYYINEDDTVLRISESINDDGERSICVILKGCIKSINKLKVGKQCRL